MLTLNQEIEILKNFTSLHRGLNSYFHEGVNKIVLNSDSPVYPKFESILESMSNTNDMVSVSFKLFASDLVNKDKSNKDQVISDCMQYANDFLYYMRKIVRDQTFPGFRCSKDIQLTDYVEAGTDEEAGVYFDFTMTSHIGSYNCGLPIDSGNILDNNYIYVNGTTTPITSNTMFDTEDFIYGTDPLTLSRTPTAILSVHMGSLAIFETEGYTRPTTTTFTIINPAVENGDIIRITYAYTS